MTIKRQCYDCELIAGILQEAADNEARWREKYEYALSALRSIDGYRPHVLTQNTFFIIRQIASRALDFLNDKELQ